MFPLIINDNPSKLVQLSMRGAVGHGAPNHREDVRLVQTLLNGISAGEGPQSHLRVDGICGPLTVAAIRRYQSVRTGIVDGRVDPTGPSIKSLVKLLNARNALPRGFANLGPPSHEFIRALSPGASSVVPAAAPSIPATPSPAEGNHLVPASPIGNTNALIARHGEARTGWDFATSSQLSGSVSFIGVNFLNIFMTHDIEPGLVYRFTFAGAGVGLSALPVGADFSTARMPSRGTEITRGAFGKAPPISASDFVMPACVLAGELNLPGFGIGGAVVYYGAVVPMVLLSHYVGFLAGGQIALQNAGIALFVGAIAGFK